VLKARTVETLTATEKRQEIPDGIIPGLYLIVQPSGKKSWALRYRFHGKPRKLTLGKVPVFGLLDARTLARAALEKVARDIDPCTERTEKRQQSRDASRLVVEQLPRFVRHMRDVKKQRAWRNTERQLKNDMVAVIGKKAIQDVTSRDVRDILLKAEKRGITVGVNRLTAHVSSFFKWAVQDDLITANPAEGFSKRHPETSRDRVLSDAELLEVWRAAGAVGGPYGALVQFLALTGQRRGEAVGMTRDEISDDGQTWEIPGARTKNGKAHDVPLSAAARRVLADRPAEHDALFSNQGEKPIGDWTKLRAKLDTAIATSRGGDAEAMEPWTLHDLRRTCATGIARQGVALHVIEKILNHTGRSFAGVAGVYNRFEFMEERRAALNAWAAHIERIIA